MSERTSARFRLTCVRIFYIALLVDRWPLRISPPRATPVVTTAMIIPLPSLSALSEFDAASAPIDTMHRS